MVLKAHLGRVGIIEIFVIILKGLIFISLFGRLALVKALKKFTLFFWCFVVNLSLMRKFLVAFQDSTIIFLIVDEFGDLGSVFL